jgi:competence protein ComEC
MVWAAAGIGAVAWLPELPSIPGCAAVFGASATACAASHRVAALARCRGLLRQVLAFVVGGLWAVGYGYVLRDALLPVALEQRPLILTGTVEGIVERYTDTSVAGAQPTLRFALRVERCEQPFAEACGVSLRRVQLTAYETALRPEGGERWRLRVKLRRPRGFANPGGFDYEAWLVAQRIDAVGYVDEGFIAHAASANQAAGSCAASEKQAAGGIDRASAGAANASIGGDINRRLAAAPWWSADRSRSAAKRCLDRRAPRLAHAGLLAGLALGDGSGIPPQAWNTFRATGTVHLFVVSGLQIAFTGGLVLWLGQLWWRCPWGGSRRRDYWLGIAPACVIALGYALLAGFGLPIQRALIMFGCMAWALASRREIGAAAWRLALLLVSLGNPLAALDAGFWFSFGAVAVILLRLGDARGGDAWWRLQGALFVAALPLLLTVAGPVTLLALPANIVAVPWSTWLTMPLAFIALALEGVAPQWADAVWQLADLSLQWLCWYLCWLQQHGAAAIWLPLGVRPLGLACATIAAALYLLPRGMPGRAWAWLFLVPVVWPPLERIAPGDFRLTAIDVGQGLSALVETASHRLLYDTGPPFGPQRTVAELTVAPLLHYRGVRKLDAVVISHRDSDHAGGWSTVAAQFDVRRLLLGEPLPARASPPSWPPSVPPRWWAPPAVGGVAPSPPTLPGEWCRAGMRWSWDGVEFSVLHPTAEPGSDTRTRGNNRSCVLQVRAGGVTALLPGDIEHGVEYALHDRLQPVAILLAPHHGSRTSSTAAFVARVQPRHVVFSTGYRNRFAHPHPSVVERYVQAGAHLLDTADSGAIAFVVEGGRVVRVERARDGPRHYWQ